MPDLESTQEPVKTEQESQPENASAETSPAPPETPPETSPETPAEPIDPEAQAPEQEPVESTDTTEAAESPSPLIETTPAEIPAEIPAETTAKTPVKSTSKPSKSGSKKTSSSSKGSGSDDEEERPFDPAVDLPAYREGMNWFVLRVASNKESYVRETLLKKVQIEGLDIMVGRIMVPTEKTKTLKGGKARITETKLYPGYVFVEMKLEDDGRIPQDVFFLIKETTGVGDFVGTAGHPTPMAPHEVEKMLFDSRKPEETPTVKMEFEKGDDVVIQEGPFENYEGTVDEVLPDKGKVRVLVTIFGRQAPVELEFWQIAKAEDV